MSKTFKFFIIGFISTLISFIVYGSIRAFEGNYLSNNLFGGIFFALASLLSIMLCLKAIKSIWTMPVILFCILQGCNYAKSNQQVVVSEDCGMSWKKIRSGDAVPKSGINTCYMKVVMPNYPMQGEAKFVANLSGKVRASIHIDYDYNITDALSFINQAKFLGNANVNADDPKAIGEGFETAENTVIDKRIRDVAKAIFLQEDIVELDQSEIEGRLLIESNKVLEALGIHLNFITLTIDPDDQTREAIDVSTAMKIYRSKGLEELGKQVISQRAGATKIVVENKIDQKKED